MSALARYFFHIGKRVAGYDRTKTPITTDLEDLGVSVHYEDAIEQIHESFKSVADTLVVFTPAVSEDHSELQYFRNQGFQVKKRAEVLGLITKDTFCLAVAGTHGKTTTSCILAHLLKEANGSFTAFLGGISEDFDSNFVFKGNDFSVVEADEFDRSFLQLYPNVACITSMDADHLDIYGTSEQLDSAFLEFAQKLGSEGKLLVRKGLPIEGITFGLGDTADYSAVNIEVDNGRYIFDIKTPKGTLSKVEFGKPGRHNLMNALAAFAMAAEVGFPEIELAMALRTFKGVKRRFSYQVRKKDFIFIDDYAHHPTEIEAVFQAVSEAHPNRLVTAVFQPHLFSRTKDFGDDFAVALDKFHDILLLEIYPAREDPIPGIDSTWLLNKMENPNKRLVSKSDLTDEIKRSKPQVLVTLGAGDIGLEVPKIKKELAYAS